MLTPAGIKTGYDDTTWQNTDSQTAVVVAQYIGMYLLTVDKGQG